MSEVGEQVRDGRLVGGRYRLLDRIGTGGTGTVWRAFDEREQREVAVKQPRLPGDPQDEEHQRAAHRLYREARAAARVEHPSAVVIHEVVVEGEGDAEGKGEGEDGLPWIVMELVRGESLHEVLGRGRLAPAEAARVGLAVLGALRAAHAVGIVHRDVKPANVLLGPDGRVVLTDFGIAHVQGGSSLTVSGESVGPLEFVAPERMSATGAGPASDLWSLGVLLYAAVEGTSPFRRTTVESTLAAMLADDPPEPEHGGPLTPLIVRLLARSPEERPNAEETGTVLEAAARSDQAGFDRVVPDRAGSGAAGSAPATPDPAVTDAVPPDAGVQQSSTEVDLAPRPGPGSGPGARPQSRSTSEPGAGTPGLRRFLHLFHFFHLFHRLRLLHLLRLILGLLLQGHGGGRGPGRPPGGREVNRR